MIRLFSCRKWWEFRVTIFPWRCWLIWWLHVWAVSYNHRYWYILTNAQTLVIEILPHLTMSLTLVIQILPHSISIFSTSSHYLLRPSPQETQMAEKIKINKKKKKSNKQESRRGTDGFILPWGRRGGEQICRRQFSPAPWGICSRWRAFNNEEEWKTIKSTKREEKTKKSKENLRIRRLLLLLGHHRWGKFGD